MGIQQYQVGDPVFNEFGIQTGIVLYCYYNEYTEEYNYTIDETNIIGQRTERMFVLSQKKEP